MCEKQFYLSGLPDKVDKSKFEKFLKKQVSDFIIRTEIVQAGIAQITIPMDNWQNITLQFSWGQKTFDGKPIKMSETLPQSQEQGNRHQGNRHQGNRHQGNRHQGNRHQGNRQHGNRHQGNRQHGNRHQGPQINNAGKFPYDFCKRADDTKKEVTQFHHKLNANHFDIAFDVAWETLTPTALNPSEDSALPSNGPGFSDSSFAGYNKRWLRYKNRLAMSPFTIKSAIANGFANLLGGSYRTNKTTVKHKPKEEGHYPYGGQYNRYRVQMNNSLPGILKKFEQNKDGSYDVEIQPVTECYFDDRRVPGFVKPGGEYYAEIKRGENRWDKHKFFVTPGTISKTSVPGTKKLYYFGEYEFGMDLTLRGGELGKRHYHRFYQGRDKSITTTISADNFLPVEKLEEKVYVGEFKKTDNTRRIDPRRNIEGNPWYENLNQLKEGDWVYYQDFQGKVYNIGKCFQFKALFLHEDTIPEGNRPSLDLKKLCAKERMFGASAAKSEDKEAIGYRGRFKSSTLVSSLELEEKTFEKDYPDQNKVTLRKWLSQGKEIARQLLLPILATPKPNKRDVNGYYDEHGNAKGAKYFLHADVDINTLDQVQARGEEYSHKLRNYAQVCHKGVTFTGTLGAENCSIEEIAALFILLHHDIAQHGFKLGLGKALGMGTVVSKVNKIWLRDQNYQWQQITIDENFAKNRQLSQLPGLSETIAKILKPNSKAVNSTKDMKKTTLEYPDPGHQYWRDVQKMTNNR